jgi:NAD-dependent DNA ligase
MSSSGSPTWLIALMVVLAIAAAVTFALFVDRHAKAAALTNQYIALKEIELPQLRVRKQQVADQIPKLDEAIRDRREKALALEENEKSWFATLDTIVQTNKTSLGEIGDANRKEVKTYADKMREAPERRAEVGREEERATAQEHDFDENRRKLRDEIEQLAQAVEQEKKKGRSELVKLDARVVELEDRVRFLTNQLDVESREMRADGTIIAAESASSGFVVIDRGNKHNLRRNTRFTVYTQRAGKNVIKGLVEVVKVEDRLATCRVLLEKDRNDPFIDGDKLHNPVWDPDRIKSFAIRGDFRRFSRAELERFIVDGGGRVDSELKTGTDYLVAGGASEKWTEMAVKLGVSILSEDQLLDFIRPQE